MSHGHFLRAFREYGVKGTFERLYKMRTLKFGNLVGTDAAGNKYFENYVDYPHPHNRWVEYSGDKNFYEMDATNVPAEWHGWLHNSTLEPPTATTTGSTHKTEPIQIAHGSSAPYKRNLGGVISAPSPNRSQVRPRGFGLDNSLGSKPNEEAFYTQPGYPTDKRNKSMFVSQRRERMRFSLRDTPLTLQAKAAARTGLGLDEYQAFTEDEHPTKALLLLTGGHVSKDLQDEIMAKAEAGAVTDLFREAVSALPEDEKKRALAVRLASGLGATKNDKGSFAAEAAAVLTVEEESLLSQYPDIQVLHDKARTHQKYIDDYVAIEMKEVKRAVAKAIEVRDDCLTKIAKLEAAYAKLDGVTAKFDDKAYAMAQDAVDKMA